MANPITVKTTPIMIKWGKNTILDWSDDVTYYYKEEMVANGTAGNRTFDITILRSDTPDFSVSTEIGTRNKTTGAITLTNGAPVEEANLKTLTNKLKGNASALNILFSQYDTLTDEEKTKLDEVTGTKNVATTNENDDTDDDTTSVTPVFTDIDVNLGISRKARSSYGNYYYPADLETNKQDRIRFEMKYTEGTIVNSSIESHTKQFQRKTENIGGSVTLPIVTGIADINEVDWEGAKLNPLQALGAGAALRAFDTASNSDKGVQAAIRGFGGAAGNLGKEIKQVGGDLKTALNVYLAQQAVGTQNLLSRTSGAIVNPNLEMLFSGPALRKFGFTFKLSPRDANEANQVRKILRFFKQGMSVKTSDSNVFLKAPNVFDINYQTFDGTREISHPSINKIKTCALLACDVQYTPDGTYMTYDDPSRTMTSYQLTLQFNELDPIYDTDYTELDNDQDNTIGY